MDTATDSKNDKDKEKKKFGDLCGGALHERMSLF